MSIATLIVCLITLGALFVVLSGKYKEEATEDPVWLANQKALESRFGQELNIKDGQLNAPPVIDGWFVKLREKRALNIEDKIGSYSCYSGSSDCVVRDQGNSYFHVLIRSISDQRNPPHISTNEPLITPLTESRARQALFNDSDAYQNAFGELPSANQLRVSEKAENYNLSIHDTEIANSQPVGGEFGVSKT